MLCSALLLLSNYFYFSAASLLVLANCSLACCSVASLWGRQWDSRGLSYCCFLSLCLLHTLGSLCFALALLLLTLLACFCLALLFALHCCALCCSLLLCICSVLLLLCSLQAHALAGASRRAAHARFSAVQTSILSSYFLSLSCLALFALPVRQSLLASACLWCFAIACSSGATLFLLLRFYLLSADSALL
ncbi:hypothetical protein Tco_0458116 [Tanacetum coccineum]